MANRYWVGGSGTWNSTNTNVWSASSGGASGASVPTAADSVFFDQAGTYTATLTGGGIVCLDITVSVGTVTIAGTGGITISGSMSLSASTVWSHTGTVLFNATTTGKTITTNGVSLSTSGLTFNGVGGSWQLQGAMTIASTSTVTLTNGTLDLNGKTLTTGLFSSTNANARTIAFGTGNITTVAAGTPWNTGTITNLTITGTPTVNISYSGASAVTITPGALTEANAINFNITAGTYTLTISSGSYFGNLDFTGFAGTWTGAINDTVNYWKGFTLSTGMTLNPSGTSNTWTLRATSGTHNINTNGKSLGGINFNVNGAGGTWKLQNDLTVQATTNPFTLTNGTLDLNGKTLFIGIMQINAGTKNITFNGGTIQIQSQLTSWNNANPTGFTTTAGTGTGVISMTNASAKTFSGGGSVYNCNLSNDGAGAITVSGSNTFRSLSNSSTARTYTFTAGTTTTFTNLSFTGAAANLITINSTTTSAYTFSQSSGTVSCDYISIGRCVTTGGASFYAGANSTNGGNNTGWTFTAPPAPVLSGAFFMFF